MSRAQRRWNNAPVRIALLLLPALVLLWVVVGTTSPTLITISVIVWTLCSTGAVWALGRHYSTQARDHRERLHNEQRAEMYAAIHATMNAGAREAEAVREALAVVQHEYDALGAGQSRPSRAPAIEEPHRHLPG